MNKEIIPFLLALAEGTQTVGGAQAHWKREREKEKEKKS